ncbi:hypothetical protein [Actinomadura macra]|uniref:hypothetical protein n=1 Tax=Actinomadura macra TaxID=46164 RepID=UPI000832BCD6|nr:hypothetical protein [Actinomadura macra]
MMDDLESYIRSAMTMPAVGAAKPMRECRLCVTSAKTSLLGYRRIVAFAVARVTALRRGESVSGGEHEHTNAVGGLRLDSSVRLSLSDPAISRQEDRVARGFSVTFIWVEADASSTRSRQPRWYRDAVA